jgi:hypothetical protein
MGGTCNTNERLGILKKIVVRKSEETRPLGRPRRRWEDNIRVDLRKVVWKGVDDWLHLAQDWDHWRVF